jgi:hypothetical protein
LGHAQNRRIDNNLDDGYEQHQLEDELDQGLEPDPEQEYGSASDLELEPNAEVLSGLDMLALVNKTKVRMFIIGYLYIHSQLSES